MKTRTIGTTVVTVAGLLLSAHGACAAGDDFDSELLSLQHEWAHANYETHNKRERKTAFEGVVEHAAHLSAAYPNEVAAVAWDGIVLSTFAGEVGAFSAMKYANAAKEQLLRAMDMDANALDGGIYASLGALYSKVPGGFMGFGDDDLAREYFQKALAVNAGNIDNNYFYGEFLIDQGELDEALSVLKRALGAPVSALRPVFDAGRRGEIGKLIAMASAD
jgi:tetratricopeptide (TPR) repeat protein